MHLFLQNTCLNRGSPGPGLVAGCSGGASGPPAARPASKTLCEDAGGSRASRSPGCHGSFLNDSWGRCLGRRQSLSQREGLWVGGEGRTVSRPAAVAAARGPPSRPGAGHRAGHRAGHGAGSLACCCSVPRPTSCQLACAWQCYFCQALGCSQDTECLSALRGGTVSGICRWPCAPAPRPRAGGRAEAVWLRSSH